MASLKPLFDSKRRTDFGYPEPYGGAGATNPHDYTYQTPPQKPYGAGAKNHDYTYQTPPLSHTPQKPYGGENHHDYTYQTPPASPFLHHGKPFSPPVVLDDGAAAAIEWKETPDAHIFKTHLPSGIRREDVRVQIEDDQVLKIIDEKVSEAKDRYHGNWRLAEVSRGRFVTSLKLPEDAKADLIKCYWENGALTVRIPRREMMFNWHHHVRNLEISDRY